MISQAARPNRPIRVLIVDDSAMIRKVLSIGLSSDPMLQVVGAAAGAEQAFEMIEALSPDVMTLDIEMPRMDGVTFLRQLIPRHPLPTVVISSATRDGAVVTLKALEAGAVDVIAKPSLGVGQGLGDIMPAICQRVRTAAFARPARGTIRSHLPSQSVSSGVGTDAVIVIGASTGGVQALGYILDQMPPDAPGIVIVQHMPEGFTAAFANRLNAQTRIEIKEAEPGDAIRPGRGLIAPGGARHMVIAGRAPHLRVELIDGPPVCYSRPAVDMMIDSAARLIGPRCVAVLLTGMGKDGAAGLLAVRKAGGTTIVQDEASSVVWGMPGAAVELGAAQSILPLEAIPAAMIAAAQTINDRSSARRSI
jgi:two-component system, chemotaxis family, protein-glutamate methylesterase/glutaminase